MGDAEISGKLSGLLQKSASILCHWLCDSLPKLDARWWSSLVLPSLSPQQQQWVDRKGISSLSRLDLAALLRILDRNWYELSSRHQFTNQERNYVKEMQTVRNRWAHIDVHGVDADEMYRDVDTIQRFLKIFGSSDEVLTHIRQVKSFILHTEMGPSPEIPVQQASIPVSALERPWTEKPEVQTADTLKIGQLVALVSDPAKTGVVMSVSGTGGNARYTVFLDGRPQPFYAPQLHPVVQETEKKQIDVNVLHSLLTGLQIRHPSLATLYSLNAARIDFVPYQFRPALKIIQSDQPRLLIADSVGVGKTIEAGLIMRELQARNNIESVLIICPKPLVAERKWELEMKRFDENFTALDGNALRYCINETDLEGAWPDAHAKIILPYSLLQDETLLHGEKEKRRKRKGLLDLDPPPKFDLVIVDEAHHVRNSSTCAHQAVQFFCEHAEAVVFMTATPVQMGNQDLFTLLNLLRPDLVIDKETFSHMAEPNPYINKAVTLARSGGDKWQVDAKNALEQAASTAWGKSILQRNPRFMELLKSLGNEHLNREERIAAVLKMEDSHSFSRLINRTRRRDIGTFCVRRPETIAVPFTHEQKKLHDELIAFQAKALEAVYGERSVDFLISMIRRQAASCIFGLAPFITTLLQRRLSALEWMENSDEEMPASDFFQTLENEALAIAELAEQLPPEDPKYNALLHVVKEKNMLPNNKAMIFSSFRHTLAYLERKLQRDGIRIGLVHGDIKDEDRMALRNRFELPKDDPSAIDVMLFSEVGCEGLDYQFCDMMINYDLPWNPMRIEQRIGRIDRRGQKSEAVAIYNLITPGTVDADIYERCLLRIGVFESSIGECEEILGDISREIRNIAENLTLTESQRQKKLEQLADNEIRTLQEQKKLEEKEHELFGLQLPRTAPDSQIQDAESYWLTAASIQRFVLQYLNRRLGSADYILSEKPFKTLRLSQDARGKLLDDFRTLETTKSPMFRTWEKWLKGDEPHATITFDSACAADHRDTFFIMPLHPLVLQASRYLDVAEPVYTAFRIQETDLEPGHYSFAIYAWEIKGLRPELRLMPICGNDAIRQNFFTYLEAGAAINPADHPLSPESEKALDQVHHELWAHEKTMHQSKTAEMVRFRKESLETSQRGRENIINEKITNATNDKIRTMKQAEINNIQREYNRKLAGLGTALTAADIHARPVVFGKLIVEK